jgi:hypothetical protein
MVGRETATFPAEQHCGASGAMKKPSGMDLVHALCERGFLPAGWQRNVTGWNSSNSAIRCAQCLTLCFDLWIRLRIYANIKDGTGSLHR